jgi:hypothetical protein
VGKNNHGVVELQQQEVRGQQHGEQQLVDQKHGEQEQGDISVAEKENRMNSEVTVGEVYLVPHLSHHFQGAVEEVSSECLFFKVLSSV